MSERLAFLAALRAGLAALPEAEADAMLADFDGHFTEALAAGRTERQAAQRLGDPVWLARECLAPRWPRWGEADPDAAVCAGG